MFTINFDSTDYAKLVNNIACQLKVKVQNDTLILTEEFAQGYIKFIHLSNGLQCLLSDYKLNDDLYMQRKGGSDEFYIFRFDEISTAGTLMIKVDNDYAWEEKPSRASVLLTSSLHDFAYQIPKGSSIKSINVLITRKWIEQYLDLKSMDSVLGKYLKLKTASYNFAPFDVAYRTLFNEVMEEDNAVMNKVITENRIMMLVEKFLSQLYQKINQWDDKIKISPDEVKRLMDVESYLVKDLSTPPPPISFLSRVAAMSTTTLKNKFKVLYGANLYEYFQKSRMHKAKILIMSKKYSIKEIGSKLGYTNLSNFAAAFKKEFKKLPSRLLP